jgi:hypothetical protein
LATIRRVVGGIGEAHLADLTSGLHGRVMLRLLDAIGYRAKGDTGQNGDDPYDHEEFNEGETASAGISSGAEEEAGIEHG